MPYIKNTAREQYDGAIENLIFTLEKNEFPGGHLNYIISKLCNAKFRANRKYSEGESVVGLLECAKQEFYRKMLAPLEEEKIKENGDV